MCETQRFLFGYAKRTRTHSDTSVKRMSLPSKRSSPEFTDISLLPSGKRPTGDDGRNAEQVTTGVAPLRVLYCPSCILCTLADKDNVRQHEFYKWARRLSCPSCQREWIVCAECPIQRKPMHTHQSVYWHNYRYHRGASDSSSGEAQCISDSAHSEFVMDASADVSDVSITTNESPCPKSNLKTKALPGEPKFHFSGIHNNNYFEKENRGRGLGRAYLVGMSQFKLGIMGADVMCDEVDLHMNIAGLVASITSGQREKLATVLRQVVTVTRRQGSDELPSQWDTRVPMTVQEIRSMYVEGNHAILPNLPRPPVHLIGDHAYVSLRDCVSDLLGHGMEVDCIERATHGAAVTRISETMRAQRILDNSQRLHVGSDVLTLYITEWSDGFEPSLSIKGNRGSCWIKTVTISPPPSKIHSLTHTYPIALGQESDSHEEVEQKFAEELTSFGRGDAMDFYHGSLKRNVRVHLELFVSLQDQPERRSANYIMLGTSSYTARWGLALDFVAVASGIPACSNCLTSMLREPLRQMRRQCTVCVNWDTDVANGLLDFPLPDHYPEELIPRSGKLSPRRLTYEVMKSAVETAHKGVVFHGWSMKNLKAYLRVNGLNAEAIASISECAMNCLTYNDLLEAAGGGDAVTPELAAKQRERRLKPELFEMWKFPALWVRGVQLHQHIDVAMHLIFLGVIKTTIQMIQKWTKERGKHTAFLQYSHGVFESVQRLGLDWCRCLPYKSGKLGGWVSENYLAAARLMNWFYGSIDDIASDPVFVEPDRPMNKWTKVHNQGWLGIRGLDTRGSADEVKARVIEYIHRPGGPPAELPPQGGEVTNVHAVLAALKAMVSRLMCRSVTESLVHDVERHIKIFLSKFETFDSAMRNSEDTPTWISSYNFICLTNLPMVLQEFGPLRNLWEGAGQGEKILSLVKPSWIGLRKNWQQNMLDRLLRQTAMGRLQATDNTTGEESMNWMTDHINDDIEEEDEEEDASTAAPNIFRGNHLLRRYKNMEHAKREFELRRPLSVVVLDGLWFCCVLQNNETVRLQCMDFIGQIAGATYHKWQIEDEEVVQQQQRITSMDQLTHYCILLPKLSMHGLPDINEDPIFTLIDSEWNEIQPDGSITLPKIVGVNYNEL